MANVAPTGEATHTAVLMREGAGGNLARKALDSLGGAGTILAFLVAWEVAAQLELVIPFLLPALSLVITRIAEDLASGKLIVDIAMTLFRATVAFGIAAFVGVALGIVIARTLAVRWFLDPLISIGLPMPKIALLPIFMLWFGLFDLSKIMMVAFSVAFQIVIATWSATHGVEKEMIWSARSLGATDRQVLREVILPAALPQVLTGLQVAMPVCLIVVLVTEMAMGGRGLGDSMLMSARYLDSPGVFAGIIEIGLLGFAVIRTMEYIRRRLLVWHSEGLRAD